MTWKARPPSLSDEDRSICRAARLCPRRRRDAMACETAMEVACVWTGASLRPGMWKSEHGLQGHLSRYVLFLQVEMLLHLLGGALNVHNLAGGG